MEDYDLPIKRYESMWAVIASMSGVYPTTLVQQVTIVDISVSAKHEQLNVEDLYLVDDKRDIHKLRDLFSSREEAKVEALKRVEEQRQWFLDIFVADMIKTGNTILDRCIEEIQEDYYGH